MIITISTTEVAQKLGVCWLTAARWLARGQVPGRYARTTFQNGKVRWANNRQVFEKWLKTQPAVSERSEKSKK